MDENHTHEEFGELKNQYSLPQNVSVRDCFIPQMRENLIARNGGSHEVKLYAGQKVIDVNKCDIEELFAADYALKSFKGV